MKTETMIEAMPLTAPALEPVIEWLIAEQIDIAKIVERAMANLRRQSSNLPRPQLIKYCTKAVLNEFFPRWAMKNRGKLPELLANSEAKKKELRPFEFALMFVGDERAFKKIAPQFVQSNMARRLNTPLRTAEEFSIFVGEKSLRIADLFLSHFDPSRKTSAVSYLQKTAVSLFLTPPPSDPDNLDPASLEAYLKTSKRLNHRTILALKLSYLPLLMTTAERKVLRKEYGFTGNLDIRLKKQDIAKRLGFQNAAALSRKLYKVRKWSERHVARHKAEGRNRG